MPPTQGLHWDTFKTQDQHQILNQHLTQDLELAPNQDQPQKHNQDPHQRPAQVGLDQIPPVALRLQVQHLSNQIQLKAVMQHNQYLML